METSKEQKIKDLEEKIDDTESDLLWENDHRYLKFLRQHLKILKWKLENFKEED